MNERSCPTLCRFIRTFGLEVNLVVDVKGVALLAVADIVLVPKASLKFLTVPPVVGRGLQGLPRGQ